MKRVIRKPVAMIMAVCMVFGLSGCGNGAKEDETPEGGNVIALSDDGVQFNGSEVGTKEASVYLSNDIIYYEDKDAYESGNPYGEGKKEDKHSAEEAAEHTVVNITEAGIYRLQGKLSKGQVRIDLGEQAKKDPKAVVTLILDGVELNCDVAPAILFLNVYECDYAWDPEEAKPEVDTTAAGANLVIADESSNHVEGAYVAKIFKDKDGEKKLWKQDAAIYSYMSLNVNGETEGSGTLDITADNEGLDTELHLTINGGNINIRSQNDGINTNEDGVSVTTINGGTVHIMAGLGAEGDGVDSNGWLVINGGTVISGANPKSDSGLDSSLGSYVNGGTVVALGSTMDWAESDSGQVTMNLQFAEYRDALDAILVKNKADDSVVFSYDPSEDEVFVENAREYMGAIISCPEFALDEIYEVYAGEVQQGYTGTDVGGHFGGLGGGTRPDGKEPPKKMERPEGMVPPKEMERPEGMEPPKEMDRPEGEGLHYDFYMQDKVNSFSGVSDKTAE